MTYFPVKQIEMNSNREANLTKFSSQFTTQIMEICHEFELLSWKRWAL